MLLSRTECRLTWCKVILMQSSLWLQLTRPHAVKTVKYVNPHGGTWTVAAQRIPAEGKEDAATDLVSLLLLSFLAVNNAGYTAYIIAYQQKARRMPL